MCHWYSLIRGPRSKPKCLCDKVELGGVLGYSVLLEIHLSLPKVVVLDVVLGSNKIFGIKDDPEWKDFHWNGQEMSVPLTPSHPNSLGVKTHHLTLDLRLVH